MLLQPTKARQQCKARVTVCLGSLMLCELGTCPQAGYQQLTSS